MSENRIDFCIIVLVFYSKHHAAERWDLELMFAVNTTTRAASRPTTYSICAVVHYTNSLLVVSGKTGIANIFSWDMKKYTK